MENSTERLQTAKDKTAGGVMKPKSGQIQRVIVTGLQWLEVREGEVTKHTFKV